LKRRTAFERGGTKKRDGRSWAPKDELREGKISYRRGARVEDKKENPGKAPSRGGRPQKVLGENDAVGKERPLRAKEQKKFLAKVGGRKAGGAGEE